MLAAEIRDSIETSAAYYGADKQAVRDYLLDGAERAYALKNRGPIRFDENGKLQQDIIAAYSQYGFYVFTGVLSNEELTDIKSDLAAIKAPFPVEPGALVDSVGRPALGADRQAPTLVWSKPLADPLGGTAVSNGRHQVKLIEPEAAPDAPEQIVFILLGSLQFSDASLRVYGHPQLLQVAAEINGEDFAPSNEALFIKEPGLGAAVPWHQDGTTPWDSPGLDEGTHGFNYVAQVYGSDPVNGVWIVPGTHKMGKVDIKKLVEEAGSERFSGAVPLMCNPGDVVICNRQLVHGSFANTGRNLRVTVNFGFHRRASVLGVKGAGIHSKAVVYDEAIIHECSRLIGLAIDTRRPRFPEQEPFRYQPFVASGETYHRDDAARASVKDYNRKDLSI